MTADRNPTPRELAANPVREAAHLFRGQVERALRFLGSSDPADIHRARKQLKSARATLRLLRPAIGDGRYRRENIAARDAARKLSQARDSIVLLDSLDDLAQRAPDDMPSGALEALRAALRRRHDAVAGRQLRSGRLEAKRTLQEVATRSTRWILPLAQGTLILDGARATYRRGRHALRDAKVDPTIENLHDWRKQVKYGWHQLQFFTPLAHGHLGALADDFHKLSDYLGDDHDLAMLQDFILEQHGVVDPDSAAKLRTLISKRRAELQARAFASGERLYEASSKEFLHWLRDHLHDWRNVPGQVLRRTNHHVAPH